MSALAASNRALIQECFDTLSNRPKTEELIDRFIADPILKQHVLKAEVAFPSYQLVLEQMVAEGDIVAVRATMNATHARPYAGIPPTGLTVSAGCMVFYRIAEGRIVQHWVQLDTMSLTRQLTAQQTN